MAVRRRARADPADRTAPARNGAARELGYLFEVGRITTPALDVLDRLVPALELTVSNAPFGAVVAEALRLTWTGDPFDRLITAQALVDRAEMLTADETILAHCPSAVWQAPGSG